MNKKLSELLSSVGTVNEYIDTSSNNFTHVTVFPPTQKWCIRPHKIGAFWESYAKLVDNKEKALCIAERNNNVMPLIIDFKFCFDAQEGSDLIGPSDTEYDNRFLLTLISCIQTVLLETLQVSEERLELVCCVLESIRSWVEINVDESKAVCRLLRLQFPYCRIEANVASQLIFPRIITVFRQKNVIGMLPSQPKNDWPSIIDLNVMDRPILLYGSVSHPNEPMKVLRNIYGVIERDHLDEVEEPPILEPEEIFKISNHHDAISGNISTNTLNDGSVEFWLPLALSINFYQGVVRILEYKEPKKIKINSLCTGTGEESDLSLCKIFIAMLNKNRFNDKIYWLDIGRALYKATDGSDEGLNEWIKVTEQSTNSELDACECEALYPEFYESEITVKTLAWYAREDSPTQYENWHRSWIFPVLEQAIIDSSHTDVARALYRCYWLEFVFVSQNNRGGVWYRFRNHRWIRNDMGIDLKKLMSTELVRRFEQLRSHYSQQVSQSSDDFAKNRLEVNIKKITALILSLKTQSFKSNVFKESYEYFHLENFMEVLNQNTECIAHRNCISEVYECSSGGGIIFRPGKPEDYISKSTGVRIDFDMNWAHATVKSVMKWFRQMFPDKELLDTFLKWGASLFVGGNPDKYLVFWTGEGNNSKSMLVKAIEKAFGSYCCKLPPTALTSTPRGNGPSPELAQMEGARIVIADELDEFELLKTSFLKRATGGDSFFARKNHQDGGKIKATSKLISVCNKVPRVNSIQKAIKSRVVIFPFMSTWDDSAPEDEEVQMKEKHFKMDPFFDRQVDKMAPAILWVFSQFYGRYIDERLHMPKVVKEYTETYWENIDIYGMFLSERLHPAWIDKDKGIRNQDAKVAIKDLYIAFKDWHDLYYKGEKIPIISDFKAEMNKRLGTLTEGYWRGVYIPTQMVDESALNGNIPMRQVLR